MTAGSATGQPAVIAFGSNLGDRSATIQAAATQLAEADGVELTAISGMHESIAIKPGGADPAAPEYLNAVALIRTRLAPVALLTLLHGIEADHGRVRSDDGERWGDRTLDLDLIDFAGHTHEAHGDGPTLPHPRAHQRDFVLRPWLEVDPDAVLPGHGRVADLLAALDAAGHAETRL
jgi:2-amino-4-hydroxy-6-hydroxymethyldihydropteridine diphosphokinase